MALTDPVKASQSLAGLSDGDRDAALQQMSPELRAAVLQAMPLEGRATALASMVQTDRAATFAGGTDARAVDDEAAAAAAWLRQAEAEYHGTPPDSAGGDMSAGGVAAQAGADYSRQAKIDAARLEIRTKKQREALEDDQAVATAKRDAAVREMAAAAAVAEFGSDENPQVSRTINYYHIWTYITLDSTPFIGESYNQGGDSIRGKSDRGQQL